jgi:hypothetical protein
VFCSGLRASPGRLRQKERPEGSLEAALSPSVKR